MEAQVHRFHDRGNYETLLTLKSMNDDDFHGEVYKHYVANCRQAGIEPLTLEQATLFKRIMGHKDWSKIVLLLDFDKMQ